MTAHSTSATIPTAFIRKLYRMLDLEQPAVIGWDDSGESFSIRDAEELDARVLPRYFRGRVDVFRQHLVEHGFSSSVRAGVSKQVETFVHPCFIRGEPGKLCLIVQSPTTKRRRSKLAKRKTEPHGSSDAHSNQQSESFNPSFIDDADFDLCKLISSIKGSPSSDQVERTESVNASMADPDLHRDLAKILALHVTNPLSTSFTLTQKPHLANPFNPAAPSFADVAAFSPELMDTMVEWLETMA